MTSTDDLGDCQESVLLALRDEMTRRRSDLSWVDNERMAVALAANRWAREHGTASRVNVTDVRMVEVRAVGHVDYASKLALYVAELIVG